jgi:hypothetical protein
MLRAGITTAVDDVSLFGDYRDGPWTRSCKRIATAVSAVMAVRVMDLRLDQNFLDLTTVPADLRRRLASVRRLRRASPRTGAAARAGARIVPAAASASPDLVGSQRRSDELLRASHRLARERGFPYTIHVRRRACRPARRAKYGRSSSHPARPGAPSDITSISHASGSTTRLSAGWPRPRRRAQPHEQPGAGQRATPVRQPSTLA